MYSLKSILHIETAPLTSLSLRLVPVERHRPAYIIALDADALAPGHSVPLMVHISHNAHSFTVIKQTVFKRGRGRDNPLVSFLLAGLSSRSDAVLCVRMN